MKIKLPFKVNTSRFFSNKKIVIAFSVIISFSIWLSVMINQNPVREQVFSDITASITIDNTAAGDLGLGIVSDVQSQKFSVTVSGPNYVVSSLTADDFVISADITGVNSAGSHTLTLFGNRNSSKSGYSFKSISPATIDVVFDYIDSKSFSLTPKLTGVSAAEGLIAETPVISNSEQNTLTVKGPRGTMQKIASAGTYAEVNKVLSETQIFDSDIVLYDADGEVLYRYTNGTILDAQGNSVANNYLSLSFATVKVTQLISKKADLPTKVTFSNMPSGFSENDVSYTIDHSTSSVIGTPDVVSQMQYIELSPIDFSGISPASNKFEVSAVLNDGVRLLDSIDYFTVTINTSNYSEKTFSVNNIKCIGLDEKYTVTSDNVIKNVKICGQSSVISAIKQSDLYAVADLTDKSTGSYTVEVTIKSDKYNNIWQLGTYSIAVSIK